MKITEYGPNNKGIKMALRLFDCDSCAAHGKINFKEDDQFRKVDIVYCPFCGGDIFEEEEFHDDDEDK